MQHKVGRNAIKGFLKLFGRPLSLINQHVILIHVAEQIHTKDLKQYKPLNLLLMTPKKKEKFS